MTARLPRARDRRIRGATRSIVLVATLALASRADAQAPPASTPVPAGSQAPPPSGATPLPPQPTAFTEPTVSDPMLAPVPEAPRQIQSWDEALGMIRAQSPDYVTGYQSILRAEAQKRVALAAVLPILDVQGSYAHQFYTAAFRIDQFNIVSPPPNLWTLNVGVNWAVVDPRSIYRVGTAGVNVDVTRLSFDSERRDIALSVIQTMLATLAGARVSEVNRVGLRSALERLALTQTRQHFGQGTALDVDRGQQDVESARRLIIAGDEALLESREALGAALGSPVAISPPGDLDLDSFEVAVAKTCHLNEDIDRRPDVEAASGRLEIAKRNVHEAELLFSPTLSVGSQFSENNVAVLGPTKTWDVQALLNVPLYDGGARYGVLRDARAAAEQARQALVATRLNAIVGSAQAMRLVGVRQAARDVAKREVDLAKQIDDRTRSGYAQGLGTSLDLVTSAQALRQAEIDLAVLDFQVAGARAAAVLTNAECLY
jgi:multidrug efflux system outer membrane protein